MRFNLSIQVESEDSTQVLESSQNVDMKTRLDDQSSFMRLQHSEIQLKH